MTKTKTIGKLSEERLAIPGPYQIPGYLSQGYICAPDGVLAEIGHP